MALAQAAGNDDLTGAYGVFRDEARRLDPEVPPGDGQHRRLAGRAGGLAGLIPGRDADPLLPPFVPEGPGPRGPHEGDVPRPEPTNPGGVSCPRLPDLLPAASSPA